ncbi:MAG: hypothetical protein AAF492_17020, partial [Verrucomicrobiota bacterium]
IGLVTNPYNNLLEFQNGTNPRSPDTGDPPPAGSITIGPGPVLGVINGVTNYEEFTDWTFDDLVVLDEYEGDGPNNQQGDLYIAGDGFDSSRDLVAFYARDGGPADGHFYFRVDFHDLQALAEEGNLDLYVIIDTGNPASGELALPDEVDAGTDNRWEVVVAVFQSNLGRVYVDTDPGNNTTIIGQSLSSRGVETRDQGHPAGFQEAYFNSTLDAVEFSISRQALFDGGWNGFSVDDLNFQVFSVKDGTCNGCNGGFPGGGDIGGRNDIRDTIYDDDAAEDYWQAQSSIKNILSAWFNTATFAGRTKVSTIVHEAEPDRPGSYVQDRINNGAGAGYHRTLAVHDVYDAPLNVHITPTLASAIEWARVDPAHGTPWRDGPAFNAHLAELTASNVVDLMGTTFSDHLLSYFTFEYNRDNEDLARTFIETIYTMSYDKNDMVFYPPQRVLDPDVFNKISDMGYSYTLIDQFQHMWIWEGRQTALGNDGYRINRFHGVNCFIVNEQANNFRYANHDSGLSMSLRRLFNRKARSGTQDQVVVLLSDWEEFGNAGNANGYEANIRWIANRPWTHLVTLESIAAGE